VSNAQFQRFGKIMGAALPWAFPRFLLAEKHVMMPIRAYSRRLRRWMAVAGPCLLVAAVLNDSRASADPPAAGIADTVPVVFTRASAIGWALQNNPDLAALRQQHGIAAAAVVIARTYPFNPVWTNKLFAASGPEEAGITNRLAMEQRVSMVLEVRGQREYRRQAACAALSRTDWEIVNQENLLAVRVARAFDNVIYHQEKLRLAEEGHRLQERTADQVRRLIKANVLRPADQFLAQGEIDTILIALQTARSAQAKAEYDLRAALGMTSEPLKVQGTLDPTAAPDDPQGLLAAALERRPDLRARQAAVQETEARVRLAVADRLGNPDIGPDYELNETSVSFIGTQIVLPLPLVNTHRGDILQRQAERTRAALDLRSAEIAIEQQVHAALSRLATARDIVDTYRTRRLPNLEASLKNMETLFLQGGVDLLKVIDLHRTLLTARSGYIDALFELRQALDDLAAAVADPSLTIGAEPGGAVP
jgi:cobalt-zinc-cadmium efflux system outer membrane protein